MEVTKPKVVKPVVHMNVMIVVTSEDKQELDKICEAQGLPSDVIMSAMVKDGIRSGKWR